MEIGNEELIETARQEMRRISAESSNDISHNCLRPLSNRIEELELKIEKYEELNKKVAGLLVENRTYKWTPEVLLMRWDMIRD